LAVWIADTTSTTGLVFGSIALQVLTIQPGQAQQCERHSFSSVLKANFGKYQSLERPWSCKA
jgi:hypothetical protein